MFKRKVNIFIIFIFIIIFLYKLKLVLLSECNYTHPIKKNGECTIGGCLLDEYKSGGCSIENDLIKIQWLTNIINYSENGIGYATLATTPQGNLICISNCYEGCTKRYFYGLTKNGRPYFISNNIETLFYDIDVGNIRNEGNIFMVFN